MELGNRVLLSIVLIFIVALAETQGHKFFGGRSEKSFYDHGLNKGQLRQFITSLANEQSTEVHIEFLTAMNSTKVRQSLKRLKLEPSVIQQLLTKLKGTPQQVTEAKQAIKDQWSTVKLDQFTKKDWKAVGELVTAYKFFLGKEMAKKAISEENSETLVTAFTALSKQERYSRFRGILFTDLLWKLQYNGEQGRKEVIETVTKWIDTVDPKSLQKVTTIYIRATQSQKLTTIPPTTTTPFICVTQTPSSTPGSTPGSSTPGSSTPSSSSAPTTTPEQTPE